MDEAWAKLQTVSIRINADRSPREVDRTNANKLSNGCAGDNWEAFYEALEALERGCGYSDHSDLTALCKTASLQDDRRLLQIIEQKAKLFDVVLFLRSVDPAIKLAWINNCSFTKAPVLFECLRQALAEAEQNEPEADAIVKGLCNLREKSSEHFRYLLSHNILYKESMIPVASKLLEHIPKEGWAVLSQCISFDDVTQNQMRFWDQCANELTWNTVYRQAEPLLEAWGAYMLQSLSGQYRQSLYCDVSNMLITILVHKLDTFGQYLDAMEKAAHAGEVAMYRWYEHESQQFGALIACLSIIEHLRYVWLKNAVAYAKPFPEKLRFKCSTLISQWRYLWVSCGKDGAGKEIIQLENWLKCVPTV